VSASSSDNPLWRPYLEQVQRIHGKPAATSAPPRELRPPMSDYHAAEARHAEWTAGGVGRLGRRLLADVEPYLAFFSIARAE
jgi:hypothetical protein